MVMERNTGEVRYATIPLGIVNLAAMRASILRWLLLLTLSVGPAMVHAQEEGISQRKQEKILAKKGKEDKKAAKKKVKTDRKRQLDIQDKATRKRMKQHFRRADRGGSGRHRDGFFTRLFSRKR